MAIAKDLPETYLCETDEDRESISPYAGQRCIMVNGDIYICLEDGVWEQVGTGGGVTPSGDISITENGYYNVTQYAGADVEVPNSNIGYQVTFKVDGEDYFIMQCLQGESITEPPIPEIEAGYVFAGWQTQGGITVTFPFTPSENIELTVNIIPLEYVSWAEATGTQIVNICNALKANTITLDELNNRTNNGWVLGAEKIVTLSAMPTYNYSFNGDIYTIEAHEEQQVTYVLANIGAPELADETDTITRVDGGEISFVVAQKDSLKEKGYINPVVDNTGSWQDCARRKWCNEIYYGAIPPVFANCIKQANIITAESQQGVDVQITEDYCFLPAAKEVLGGNGLKAGDTYDPNTRIGNFANYYECIQLSQLLYYVVNSEHKRKAVNGSYFDYWSRSPFYPSGYTGFHSVTSGGFCGNNYGCNPTNSYGLAPMFVIGGDI